MINIREVVLRVSKKYIQSPLNYVGGKHKILPQIEPLFPKDINTFVDLFTGGCNVGINAKADRIICNDTQVHVVKLFKHLKTIDSKDFVRDVQEVIKKYKLSNTSELGYDFYDTNSSRGVGAYNKENYMKLRDDFNKDLDNSLLFYVTVVHAFNNQIRFNSDGEFNMPVNKRDFNNSMKNKLINFIDKLHELNIFFTNKDFRDLRLDSLDNRDFVYCDPPYLLSTASYNESGGWTEDDEHDLLKFLDNADDLGIKFALSNMLESKGRSNDLLKEWSDNYTIHFLDKSYNNSNYQRKSNEGKDIEVLITNY